MMEMEISGNSSEIELEDISKTIESIGRRIDQVQGMKASWKNDVDLITKTVSIDKAHLKVKDQVKEVFEGLQFKMHQRTVGQFEALLTAALNEIFDIEDKVVINLSMNRQAAQLEVNIETSSGDKEEVINGRGGSVANVLSAGLRFIALTRSGLRPFIVFDEADCWLRPDKVAAFNAMIWKMSTELNVQALIISHHDEDYFDGHAELVYIQRSGGTVSTTSLIDKWNPDQKGIRSLYLEDCMSHERTMLTLSPYVTGIIGHNEAGKSNIVEALRALFQGYRSDSIIRHKKDKCLIEADLGPEGIFSYERKRKGGRKTCYRLKKDNQIIHESLDSMPPEWVRDLGFGTTSDLDVQLGHQKQPIFLLNESNGKKAAVLSVGHESCYLDKMQSIYKKLTKEREISVKEGEKRLDSIEIKQTITKDIPDIQLKVARISDQWLVAKKEIELASKKIELLNKLSLSQLKILEIDALDSNDNLPDIPVVRDAILQDRVLSLLCRSKEVMVSIGSLPALPSLKSTPELDLRIAPKSIKLLGQISTINFSELQNKVEQSSDIIIPELSDITSIKKIGKQLWVLGKTLSALPQTSIDAPVVPEISSLKSTEIKEHLSKIIIALENSHSKLSLLSKEESEGEHFISKAMNAIDVCPLCRASTHKTEDDHTHYAASRSA